MSLRPTHRINPLWKRHVRRGRAITLRPDPVIRSGQGVMLLGSCFAEEIRLALGTSAPAVAMLPDYALLDFDRRLVRVDELPGRNHMNYYSVFTVLQEIERCLGLWDQGPEDYWRTGDGWQDPYRRLVLSPDRAALHEVTGRITALMRAAFARADHFVFTFGMTEVFRDRISGRYAAQKPGYMRGGGAEETEFVASTFADTLERMLRLSDLIAEAKPQARIFASISPVALAMTFSDQDIAVANMQSKSTLRAALGEAVAARANLTYVPSYEAVMSRGPDAFERDGRHVRRDVVAQITDGFRAAFVADGG